MTVTSQDIANAALQVIGDNMPPVQGQAPSFDDSPAGVALQKLYGFCVQTVARQWGWDYARNTAALALSGNAAPSPWSFEFLYPANGIEVWQLMPAAPDMNDPLPVNFSIGNTLVAGAQTKVIWTNQASARVVYNNSPSESVWDPGFREAVIRLLSSELAMALTGRPDSAQALLESGSAFETIAEGRPD